MRLPRMTTRRWMAVIAVMAPLMAWAARSLELKRLSAEYQQRSAFHKRALFMAGSRWALGQRTRVRPEPAVDAKALGLMDYHEAMWRKYESAARYPDSSIEPDTPPP